MANVDDVVAALEKFELNLIENQWSDEVWASEFTACPDDLPDEFADKFSTLSYCDIVQVLEQADSIIHLWLSEAFDQTNQSDADSTSSSVAGASWTHLQEVDYRKLLALIYYYVCKGQVNNQDVTAVHVCIKATNFYFTLLMIPGSNIYKVFHLTLFEKCLETFTLHKYLEVATGTLIKKTKQGKKQDDMGSDDEFLEMDETLTLSQQRSVVKQLNFLLSTFQTLVGKFSFKKYPEALNMSLNMMAEMTRIERSMSVEEFSKTVVNHSCAPLSRNAYLTMRDFCSELHGRVPEIVRLVLYYLMPNLTSLGGTNNPEMAKYSNKELSNIRSIAISFVTQNVVTLGEPTHSGLRILLQQICYNMVDRADYRTKATDMVVTLMCSVSMDLYYAMLKWIFRLAMMDGAHHRVIGLELLCKLIYLKQGSAERSQAVEGVSVSEMSNTTGLDPSCNRPPEVSRNISQVPVLSFSQPVNYVTMEYRKTMLAIIIDRMRDEAASVRTRALSILAELIAQHRSPTIVRLLEDVFTRPYEGHAAIPPGIDREQDFLKWKVFVAALDKVREPEVNATLIPGGRVVFRKVLDKCLDERVNVRKAALQVACAVFKFSNKWMTNENLELLGRHCRDPALSIRKEMVTRVTALMMAYPGHDPLTKLWVEEVVPHITDREIRVQEQVLQVLTHTMLTDLTTFDKTRSPKERLPWRLVSLIAEQHMRSFLVAACGHWVKAGSINHSHVRAIGTHVGTCNDGPAWVLLSAISEYLDIETPEFVLRHYLDVVAEGKGDPGWRHLVLVTLNNSWPRLSRPDKEALAKEMLARLKTKTVEPGLVGLLMQIGTGITVTVAPDELTGKQTVASWAASLIEVVEEHLKPCLSQGQGQGCSECVNVLSLLAAVAGVAPEGISHDTFVLLYNHLMAPRGGERKIRAMAVLALGRMALRSDFFARKLVGGLSQLLETSADPVLLNNVVIAIADIGERYANLIEPLIPAMSVCLKSGHKAVRDMTLVLLVELLQEDYLKARGALVFHLLALCNDPDPRTANIVKYYFTNCLLPRHAYKMYELLIPGLFHYNKHTGHPDYPKLPMSEAESDKMDLSGPENHLTRMAVYRFMLANTPDTIRIKCVHHICTAVLNGAADGMIPLSTKSGEQLLQDALTVLLTKEIKIEFNELMNKKNEDGEEEDSQKQNLLYKLGKHVFTTIQKKEIIETIVPICCKLRKRLFAEKKRLLPYLHKFLRDLVKEYKDEVNQIFKEDKQFGVEILHEIENARNESVEEEEEEEEEEGEVGGAVEVVATEVAAVLERSGLDGSRRKRKSSEQEPRPVKRVQAMMSDVSLIEPFDPEKHGVPERRRVRGSSGSSRDSVRSDDVPKHMEVQVMVERLADMESIVMPPPAPAPTKPSRSRGSKGPNTPGPLSSSTPRAPKGPSSPPDVSPIVDSTM